MLHMSKEEKNERYHKKLGINMALDFSKAKLKDRRQWLNALGILRKKKCFLA